MTRRFAHILLWRGQVMLFQDAHVLDPSREDLAVIVISHSLSNLGVIESANATALTMFGYSRRDMVGKNISIVVPPPMNAKHDAYLRRYLDTGRLVVSSACPVSLSSWSVLLLSLGSGAFIVTRLL